MRGITRSDRSPIEDAWQRNLPECPKCHAGRGDACRTPGDRSRKPHAQREGLFAAELRRVEEEKT